jgi:hypothetical protein
VIVDAYLKNITAGIDWNLAYEAVVKDAEVEPPNWDVEGIYYPRRLHLTLTRPKDEEVSSRGKP